MKIELGVPGTGRRLETLKATFPELNFVPTGDDPWIRVNEDHRPMWFLERASKLPERLASAVSPTEVGLVMGRGIPDDERFMLERDGMSWIDLRGAVHLNLGSHLIHIDRTAANQARPSSLQTRERKLGPVGMRAAQVIATFSEDYLWSTKELVERSGVSLGQAHTVLSTLEEQGLMATKTPVSRRRRSLTDKAALLDWMSDNEYKLRTPVGLYTYLYARNEMELVRKLAKSADANNLKYAVTSSTGSRLWDVPVTTSVTMRVRVAHVKLQDARLQLGLPELSPEEAGRGANIELWQDTGEVGTYNAVRRDGIRVAPMIRIWLDLVRQGGRYTDGAEILKRRILERA